LSRVGPVTLLAVGVLVVAMPARSLACVVEQGPVGAAFEDCSGGQVFNIVPPGQAGTYNTTDFSRAQAGQGFPPHTRDQEPLYADLLEVAPNLRDADIGAFYKDASFVADLSQAEQVETFPSRPGTVIIRDQQFGDDAQAFVDGVNEYIAEAQADATKMPAEYTLLQIPLLPWKATDIIATATLVQAIFAIGGGNEVASALLYQSLVDRYGQAK